MSETIPVENAQSVSLYIDSSAFLRAMLPDVYPPSQFSGDDIRSAMLHTNVTLFSSYLLLTETERRIRQNEPSYISRYRTIIEKLTEEPGCKLILHRMSRNILARGASYENADAKYITGSPTYIHSADPEIFSYLADPRSAKINSFLRTLDSLHLATFESWRTLADLNIMMLTTDEDLARATVAVYGPDALFTKKLFKSLCP